MPEEPGVEAVCRHPRTDAHPRANPEGVSDRNHLRTRPPRVRAGHPRADPFRVVHDWSHGPMVETKRRRHRLRSVTASRWVCTSRRGRPCPIPIAKRCPKSRGPKSRGPKSRGWRRFADTPGPTHTHARTPKGFPTGITIEPDLHAYVPAIPAPTPSGSCTIGRTVRWLWRLTPPRCRCRRSRRPAAASGESPAPSGGSP
jgi:hypothetical protein